MPKLILKEKGVEGEKVMEFPREEISFGRSDSSSVMLKSQGVSRLHAKIFPEGSDFFIVDPGSGNGTRLNGIVLPRNEKYILKNNDTIEIDNFVLRFQMIDEMLNQSLNEITDSDILEVKLLKKVLRALDRESIPSLEVLNGVAEGKKAFITEEVNELVIGRDPMIDFQVEEYVISRKHARIAKKWGGIIIQDLGSKNGVYVNNRRVTEEFLHDGDRIALGTIVIMFRNPKEVSFDELSKKMNKEAQGAGSGVQGEEIPKMEEAPEDNEPDDEVSYTGEALPEEQQQAIVERSRKGEYPIPRPVTQRIKLGAMELAMLGLGILVLLFGTIMLVNILFL